MTSRSHRGLTLLEVLVATALLGVVISASLAGMLGANQATERVRRVGDVQETARLALDVIANDIRNAGMGAQLGVIGVAAANNDVRRIPIIYSGPNQTVTDTNATGGTTSIVSNSIFIISGQPTTGTLSGDGTGMIGSVIAAQQGQPISVTCYAGPTATPINCQDTSAATNFGEYTVLLPASAGGYQPLLVGDYRNAVYLRPTVLAPPLPPVLPATGDPTQLLTYTEQTSNAFSPDPRAPFGFAPGAVLQRARVVHYYLWPSPQGGSYELRRSQPILSTTAGNNACNGSDNPFIDETTNPVGPAGVAIGSGPIESLQIRYVADPGATDTPASFTLVPMGVCDGPVVATLREIRLEVVARSQVVDKDSAGALRNQYSTPGWEGVAPATPTYLDAYPRRTFSVSVVPRNLQGIRL